MPSPPLQQLQGLPPPPSPPPHVPGFWPGQHVQFVCASPLQIESQATLQQNESKPQISVSHSWQLQPMPSPPLQQLQPGPPPSPP